ncbi:MAG: polysaccharide biosynthesis/export family protein [Sphingomonadaceae bacterium]
MADFEHSGAGRRTLSASGRLALGLMAAVALLSGCASRGGPVPYDVPNFGAPDRTVTAVPAEVLIAPLDKVQVNVFRVPDLSGTYEVSVSGRLDMPLIGSVPAVNLTPEALAASLEQRYGAQFLRNPDITVTIAESQQSRMVVDGGVTRPGVFAVRGGTDLMTAIALGGGISSDGNSRRVVVFRKIDGVSMAAAFDLAQIRAGQSENPAVYPGDIIYVDKAGAPPFLRELLQSLSTLAIFIRLM